MSELGFWDKYVLPEWALSAEKQELKAELRKQARKERVEEMRVKAYELLAKRKKKEEELLKRKQENGFKQLLMLEKKYAKQLKLDLREQKQVAKLVVEQNAELDKKIRKLKWEIYDLRKIGDPEKKIAKIRKLRASLEQKKRDLEDDEDDEEDAASSAAVRLAKQIADQAAENADTKEKIPEVARSRAEAEQKATDEREALELAKAARKEAAEKEAKKIADAEKAAAETAKKAEKEAKKIANAEKAAAETAKKAAAEAARKAADAEKAVAAAEKAKASVFPDRSIFQRRLPYLAAAGGRKRARDRERQEQPKRQKKAAKRKKPRKFKARGRNNQRKVFTNLVDNFVLPPTDTGDAVELPIPPLAEPDQQRYDYGSINRVDNFVLPPTDTGDAVVLPIPPLAEPKSEKRGRKREYDNVTKELQGQLIKWKKRLKCDLKVCKTPKFSKVLTMAAKLIPSKKISAENIYKNYITKDNVSNYVNALLSSGYCKTDFKIRQGLWDKVVNLGERESTSDKRKRKWTDIQILVCAQMLTRLRLIAKRLAPIAPSESVKKLLKEKTSMIDKALQKFKSAAQTFKDAMAEANAMGYMERIGAL